MSSTGAGGFQSRHFQLERVANGVYAAIARADGGAVGNAGIVDLGETTLVFDTCQTPQAARDLLAAAERLLGRPVSFVVNSHWHGDHVHGNAIFPAGAPVITTATTRELMATLAEDELRDDRADIATYLRSLEEQLAQAADGTARTHLAERLAANREYAEALPDLRLRLPEVTFDERLSVHGARRMAELLCYGGGHTGSDTILFLPEERLAFMGDLLFVGTHPWLPDGNPQEWNRILELARQLDIRTAVPGHGTLGTRDDFTPVQRYITDLTQLALQVARSGGSADDAARYPIPAAYAAWTMPHFFAPNMGFLFAHLSTTLR
jgi:glyoxylase-like metal-dependent hydrolase (beta-lactamase superfamily II)